MVHRFEYWVFLIDYTPLHSLSQDILSNLPEILHPPLIRKGNHQKYPIFRDTQMHFTYNCDPFVLGPELAIDNIPRPVWCKFGLISSSNGFFHIDSPPRPVPVGSPP